MARSDDLAKVGFGLLCTLPGTPCFFFGDEVGLEAADSEKARRPMPWDESQWNHEFLSWYRALIAMRTESEALAVGGMRWVERQPDALSFLRETANERLLVRATRAVAAPLDIDSDLLNATDLTLLAGAGTATVEGSLVRFDIADVGFAVWRLG